MEIQPKTTQDCLGITEQSLLEELIARYFPPLVGEGDVTAGMIVKAQKCSNETAQRYLDVDVQAGLLEPYEARTKGGKSVTAYRRKAPRGG